MSLYAHIVDGKLQRLGPLPDEARRLDTGEMVSLVNGGHRWMRATGWYDVATLQPGDVDATPVQKATIIAAIAAAIGAQRTRADAVAAARAAWALAVDTDNDLLSKYGAQGTDWPVGNTLIIHGQQIQILRSAVGELLKQSLLNAQALLLISKVLVELIDSADPTPDPIPPTP